MHWINGYFFGDLDLPTKVQTNPVNLLIHLIQIKGGNFDLDVTESTTLDEAIQQLITKHNFSPGRYEFYYSGRKLRDPSPFSSILNTPPVPEPLQRPLAPHPHRVPRPLSQPIQPAPPPRPLEIDGLVHEVVNQLGLEALYRPDNDFFRNPNISRKFVRTSAKH
jgi:hypothetical protein